jgi:hypothetical protein
MLVYMSPMLGGELRFPALRANRNRRPRNRLVPVHARSPVCRVLGKPAFSEDGRLLAAFVAAACPDVSAPPVI